MSYPTLPAFVHYGPWDDESRAHPIANYMERYIKDVVDGKAFEGDEIPPTQHHTDDFILVLSDGRRFEGVDAAWKAAPEVFAAFPAIKHSPFLVVVWQETDGWVMIGLANLFFNLHAPVPETATDPDGRHWAGAATVAFKFYYVQAGDEIKVKETRIFTDPSPALKLLLQNKLVDGEFIAKTITGC